MCEKDLQNEHMHNTIYEETRKDYLGNGSVDVLKTKQ